MVLLALLLFGLLSISSTNMEFISNMDLPQIFVIAIYPGASAEDIESEVVDVLEDDFVTLPDFKSMDSQSMNSVGVVTITFRDGVDPNEQLEEVRNRISQLSSSLPSGLQGEPQALVGGATMLPVTSFTLSGGEDIAALSAYVTDELRPRLTRIPGVSTVEISGSMEPEYHVGSIIYLSKVTPENMKVGDPVTYDTHGITVTHRIIEVKNDPEYGILYRTQGDANNTADGGHISPSQIRGKPVFTIPFLGYVANFVQNPPGIYLSIGGCIILLILIREFRCHLVKQQKREMI